MNRPTRSNPPQRPSMEDLSRELQGLYEAFRTSQDDIKWLKDRCCRLQRESDNKTTQISILSQRVEATEKAIKEIKLTTGMEGKMRRRFDARGTSNPFYLALRDDITSACQELEELDKADFRKFTDELSRRKRDESEQAHLWYIIRAQGGTEYVAVPKCPSKTHLLVEEDIMTEPLVEADNLYRISTVKSSFQGLKHLPARPVYSPISADEIRDVIAHVRQVATVVTRK